ncbi:Ribonuclease T2 [Vigna unguiculata]|uniref:Ribonuclease T2 n=1 Tax=Vigna unguiculata TaxID=3917 RepID=A0A4D6KSD0_VIGUN|nr:Ribonuclease T2 [Vigna unguiculata]
MLVQQWPEGFCDYQIISGKRKCYSIPDKFVIHGLWPHREDGKLPKCKTKTHLYRKLAKILTFGKRSGQSMEDVRRQPSQKRNIST